MRKNGQYDVSDSSAILFCIEDLSRWLRLCKGLDATGFYDGIVRDGQEAFVRKYLTIEICWVVMIASNKHDPVIIAVHRPLFLLTILS